MISEERLKEIKDIHGGIKPPSSHIVNELLWEITALRKIVEAAIEFKKAHKQYCFDMRCEFCQDKDIIGEALQAWRGGSDE